MDNNSSHEKEDGQLVLSTLRGDSRSFRILVERYHKLVFNVLYRMVLNTDTAADLTQETFLKAYRGLATYKLEAKFKPWLLKIATNTGLNYMRDNKTVESIDAILEASPELEPFGKQDLELEVDWRLSQETLIRAMDELPARHRHIFLLRYQYDMSYEDISESTGEPITTIKSLLFRIREKLREKLKEDMTQIMRS